jgi:hypothetical protein
MKNNKTPAQCDTCVYYDYIDDDGTLGCTVDIDEDEYYRELEGGRHRACPYYKYYDEYKTVRKQN